MRGPGLRPAPDPALLSSGAGLPGGTELPPVPLPRSGAGVLPDGAVELLPLSAAASCFWCSDWWAASAAVAQLHTGKGVEYSGMPLHWLRR